MTPCLDQAVDEAARYLGEELPSAPAALLLLGTGAGTLPGALAPLRRISLGDVPGVPEVWRGVDLCAGRLGSLEAWLIEDAPGGLEFGEAGAPADAPWSRAFPVWLAAAAGARVCLVTAAGGGLDPSFEAPTLALVRDHLNLSGRTPLEGLGPTRLGPLFPDQSGLLHPWLAERALALASERGIRLHEVTVAGVLGPALVTPAERRWYRAVGADVFAQELSSPLLACAHAGLATLSLVAVTDRGDEVLRMSDLVARAEQSAPALEDLLLALVRDLATLASEIEEERA